VTEKKDLLTEEVDALRRLRDELRVKLHLAAADARDHFEGLEKKWRHLEARMKLVAKESREAGVDVREAAKLLASELREGYQRVKQLM
jgi:hypothetical protein